MKEIRTAISTLPENTDKLSYEGDLGNLQHLIQASRVDVSAERVDPRENWHDELISSDEIMNTLWPEPEWAVPGLLPTGLSILGGAPKVGKSLLALQMTRAVASGGDILGREVNPGPTLYFALEDPPQRLKVRMTKQNWPSDLPAHFMTIGSFGERIGDLRAGGADRIARQIELKQYRMVVIDTLSRALFGDQNDVRDMTAWLSPLQEMAHRCGCSVVLIDHHRKSGGFDVDVIADILGSTAKGAMVDTALGLYKERGQVGARLAISGREVPEKTMFLRMDWDSGSWLLDSGDGLTGQQSELVGILKNIGPCGASEVSVAVYGDNKKRGYVYNQLVALEGKGIVTKIDKDWSVVDFEEQV